MTKERLREIRTLFESVVQLSLEEREPLLRQARDHDSELASEVDQLLGAFDRRAGFMEEPIANLPSAISAAEPEPDLVGSRIDHYEIVKEIGRGGMGAVYEAIRVDGSFSKRVAVKVIRAALLTEAMRDRFRAERQILAGLDHPNIARILDGGATGAGRPYFVMEYVAGVRIDWYCRDHKLGLDGRLDLFSHVCEAVQYAHDHLIVHRDLKPGNILVTAEGAVKLLDFGIAKMLADPANSEPSSTATGSMIMTPEYASPEQVLGKPITTATDVYLLGVLLYELLAGVHPSRGEHRPPHEVMRAVCEQEPIPPSAAITQAVAAQAGGAGQNEFRRLRRQLKGDLDHMVLMALQKDPRSRYASVEQFRSDIARYRAGQPVLAQGERLSYRASKFVRRNVIAVTALALIILSLAAGVVVSALQASRARQEQRAAEQQRGIADVQTRIAQQQQQVAQEARQNAAAHQILAEQKTVEAEQQRSRADLERQRAEQRYGELRSLVTTLLFDLHDGIRNLAGSASSRRLVLSKAQQYLELLSKESGGDLQLQRELASAYEKTGDLLHEAGGPDAADGGSLASYRRAFLLRQEIAKRAPLDPAAQSDLAFNVSKVGDGEFFHGQTAAALADYERALHLGESALQRDPSSPAAHKAMGYIQNRRCIVLASAGDALHAREACRASIAYLERALLVPANAPTVRRVLVSSFAAYGNLLRNLNELPEALATLAKATDLADILAAEQPNNTEFRRLASFTQLYRAQALLAQGSRAEAMTAYAKAVASMQTLMAIDPSETKTPAGLAFTLTRMAVQMKKSGDLANAEKTNREALELLRTLAERPGSGPFEWNDYADGLVKSEFDSLRQPAKALELALRASLASKEVNPTILDTVAWAYYLTGDVASAIRIERKALGLVPAGNALGQGLRHELEQGLAAFETAAQK